MDETAEDDDDVCTKKPSPPAKGGAKPATGGGEPGKSGGKPIGSRSRPLGTGRGAQKAIVDNAYFRIAPRADVLGIRVSIRPAWHMPLPKGLAEDGIPLSKTRWPSRYGEKFEEPMRTTLVARSWMLWRARRGGWANGQKHRQRLFADEAACLARDIKQLPPQKGHVLGDPEATEMLKLWTPDVYKEVLA